MTQYAWTELREEREAFMLCVGKRIAELLIGADLVALAAEGALVDVTGETTGAITLAWRMEDGAIVLRREVEGPHYATTESTWFYGAPLHPEDQK